MDYKKKFDIRKLQNIYFAFLVMKTSGILFFGPILLLGPKNKIPELFITKKAKKHESRKSPIPYYVEHILYNICYILYITYILYIHCIIYNISGFNKFI